jgi:hypothetical protein
MPRRDGHDDGLLVIDPDAHVVTHMPLLSALFGFLSLRIADGL